MSEILAPALLIQGGLEVRLASSLEERRAAQRLRFEVFNLEQGVGLSRAASSGFDEDEFDEHCDHLLVVDQNAGCVVGTYRLLPQSRAPSFGFYSETEFDLTNVKASGLRLLELGRSCVAPGRRDGRIIDLLFRGIGLYIRRTGAQALMGCTSVHGRDVESLRRIYAALRRGGFMAAPELAVTPLPDHVVPGVEDAPDDVDPAVLTQIPPLFRAYLSLGCRVGGPPAYDPLFRVTDFFVILDLRRVADGYARRFLS